MAELGMRAIHRVKPASRKFVHGRLERSDVGFGVQEESVCMTTRVYRVARVRAVVVVNTTCILLASLHIVSRSGLLWCRGQSIQSRERGSQLRSEVYLSL